MGLRVAWCWLTRTQRSFELREFNLPNTCRVIATDRAACLTF